MIRSSGSAFLCVAVAVMGACVGYAWGFRLVERVLSRPVDASQTVEALFMHPVSSRPSDARPATSFTLVVPRDVRISETGVATGTLTSSPSESARASLEGPGLTIAPEGNVAPAAPAFDTWKWSITPMDLGEVFVQAKVTDLERKGSPDVFIAKVTVVDEFGFTQRSQQICRMLVAMSGLLPGLMAWVALRKVAGDRSANA